MENLPNIALLSVDKTGLDRNAFSGDVAVITGGGGNIGLATARSLAWLGARVVMVDINPRIGARAAELINGESKENMALFVETDITDEESVKAMSDKSLAAFGKVDILIHAAMDMSLGANILDTAPEVLDKQYAISARGALLCIRAFVPGMLERGHGVVTYLASAFRHPTAPGNYCAAKAATSSMVMSLASELGKVEDTGVAVFTMVPGWVGRPASGEESAVSQSTETRVPQRFPGANVGYEERMPPEDLGAALSYAIVHASKIHGSGITAGQVLKHIGWKFPRPELVPEKDFARLRDAAAVRIFGYLGQGFARPGAPTVSIDRNDTQPGESFNFLNLMGVSTG